MYPVMKDKKKKFQHLLSKIALTIQGVNENITTHCEKKRFNT